MIYGIGIDIIEASRIQQMLEKTPGLREDIFTFDEIKYCESKNNRHQHYAARFCAKESFLKALGTGLSEGMKFSDIEVFHNEDGHPGISLYGKAKELSLSKGISKILVSLAHIKDFAEAVVIIEKNDEIERIEEK